MTFTAVVVSNDNPSGLRSILGNLLYQTRRPDEVIVFCCNTPDVARLREDFPGVVFHERPYRGDWGHTDRAEGVALASSDYLGFFNDDDSYELDYVETMLSHAPADAVYCAWKNADRVMHTPGFRLGSSTSGNFIVRSELARSVGYPATADYENDGNFIDALAVKADRVVCEPRVLYSHNIQ